MSKECSTEWLEKRILWFTSERAPGETLTEMERYDRYAVLLEAVLKHIAQICGHGTVAVRGKNPASYAEKCLRKFSSFQEKQGYQFSDMCAGRIVVPSLQEMEVACRMVQEFLHVVKEDDARQRLSTSEFGYRSRHFDIEIDPKRLPEELQNSYAEQIKAVNGPQPDGKKVRRVAEVQVKTLLQHAWAIAVHDRLYKTKLDLPEVYHRQAATLAAQLEILDERFNHLMERVDAYKVDYGAYLSEEVMKQRLHSLELLLAQASIDMSYKQNFALEKMRLHRSLGQWEGVALLAEKYTDPAAPTELSFLGAMAQCRLALNKDGGIDNMQEFSAGESKLRQLIDCPHESVADHCLKCAHRSAFRAKVLGAVAWCVLHRRAGNYIKEALALYRRSMSCAPGNPYILRKVIECEALRSESLDFVRVMFPLLEEAIVRCEEHIAVRTEIPDAYFTAGMLHLFLGRIEEGLIFYCRGIQAVSNNGILRQELEMAADLCEYLAGPAAKPFLMLRLLLIAVLLARTPGDSPQENTPLWDEAKTALGRELPVLSPEHAGGRLLIMAGGAGSLTPEVAKCFQEAILPALTGWSGTIISGGTRSGVPGIVGHVVKKLEGTCSPGIYAVAMQPSLLPTDAPRDERYHLYVNTNPGHSFSPLDVVFYWLYLLRSGVRPDRVKVLGLGGGPIAELEYAVALTLGSMVGLVRDSGGAAQRIHNQRRDWPANLPLDLPWDAMTLRAFLLADHAPQKHEAFEAAARYAHDAYCKKKIEEPSEENLQPWDELEDTYKFSNYDQMVHARTILFDEGLDLVEKDRPKVVDLTTLVDDAAIQRMAAREHGRWNVERLRQGWQYAKTTDKLNKLHDCIVHWDALPEETKEYDIDAVKAFPAALADAGYEIVKVPKSETNTA